MRTVFKQWAARLRFQKYRKVPFIELELGAMVVLTYKGKPAWVGQIQRTTMNAERVEIVIVDADKWRARNLVRLAEIGREQDV